jgi:hypothetical protein
VPIGKEGLVPVPPALEGGVEVMLAGSLFADPAVRKMGLFLTGPSPSWVGF